MTYIGSNNILEIKFLLMYIQVLQDFLGLEKFQLSSRTPVIKLAFEVQNLYPTNMLQIEKNQ